MLEGYKTKIIIVLTVAYAIIGFILGEIDANTAWLMILAAIGSWGVYDKIDREAKKLGITKPNP